jgi:putative addiction module component (TIGR02574 family)
MQSLTLEQLSIGALELPDVERAVLVERLTESLMDKDSGLSPAWVSEVRRRRDDLRSGKVQGIPGDEALARVRAAALARRA